ncbi:hypothetical protein [Xanthomonas albilineans]|nr:hypothetical protein [Xanthomonas albilineans]
MIGSITSILPSLPFDVAVHGSPMLESTLDPVTIAVAIVIAVLPH